MTEPNQHNIDPVRFHRIQESFAKFGAKSLLLMSGIMYGAQTQYDTVERWHELSRDQPGLESLSVMAKELPDPGTVSGIARLAVLPFANIAYDLEQQPNQLAAAFATAGSVYAIHAANLRIDMDDAVSLRPWPSLEQLRIRETHVLVAAILGAEASYIAASQVPSAIGLLASLAASGYAIRHYMESKKIFNRLTG